MTIRALLSRAATATTTVLASAATAVAATRGRELLEDAAELAHEAAETAKAKLREARDR